MSTLASQLDSIDLSTCEDDRNIIEAFMSRYSVSEDEARDIFEETKKWLWLSAQRDEHGEELFIDKPLQIIDEMWHNFILHTKSYYNFCLRNFNKLVHHTPTPQQEKMAIAQAFNENPMEVIKAHEEKVTRQYSLIYDYLGPETLLKWYDTIAQKYTPEYIATIKK